MDPKQQLTEVFRLAGTQLRPAQRSIYKLKQRPPLTGQVLKMNQRLEPVYEQIEGGREVLKQVDGGLFFELVPQAPQLNDKGFAEGDHQSPKRVIAKLGMPDISGLLAGFEAYRRRNLEVPTYLRSQKGQGPANSIALFHQTGDGTSTAITWTFDAESSTLRLSKSKDQSLSITLTVGEELVVEAYLRHALAAFIAVGA